MNLKTVFLSMGGSVESYLRSGDKFFGQRLIDGNSTQWGLPELGIIDGNTRKKSVMRRAKQNNVFYFGVFDGTVGVGGGLAGKIYAGMRNQ